MNKPLLAILLLLPLSVGSKATDSDLADDCERLAAQGMSSSDCSPRNFTRPDTPNQKASTKKKEEPVSTLPVFTNVRMPDEEYVRENMEAAERMSQDPASKAARRQRYQQKRAEMLAEERSTRRLEACDSFGFERGTGAHAECAMKLYINEQNQMNQQSQTMASDPTASRNQQASALARQQAIQEAILKEQERVRRMEQSMKLIELGTGIATGSLGGRSTPKMQSHTYTINGQIINCTTTGSITNCF